MSIRLYQLEGCPYCKKVMELLDAKGLAYEKIDVPPEREKREELFELSGQRLVPVLIDQEEEGGEGIERIISDSEEILAYLNERY
ncbi:MAG: glutaredoxin [Thermodesulfobacteriota bacterium]